MNKYKVELQTHIRHKKELLEILCYIRPYIPFQKLLTHSPDKVPTVLARTTRWCTLIVLNNLLELT